jgi:hypothetical protein
MKKLAYSMLALIVAVWFSMIGDAQITKGKSRPASTKQLMAGLVKLHCAALGEALKETPADDKAWADLATKAALLNESGHILMDDGRCPDAVWAGACKTLREGSTELLAKLESKDHAGAQTAFQTVTKSCAECHKAHKK